MNTTKTLHQQSTITRSEPEMDTEPDILLRFRGVYFINSKLSTFLKLGIFVSDLERLRI